MMKYKTTYWEQTLWNLPKEIQCTDKLQELIDKMSANAQKEAYNVASNILTEIEGLLSERVDPLKNTDPCRDDGRTLLAIHDILRSNSIRLDYHGMNLPLYLALLLNLKDKLCGCRITRIRRTVAEEMSKLGLPPQKARGQDAPNRAFMDILFEVAPNLARVDLMRREGAKLWQAFGREDEKAKEEIRKTLRRLKKTEVD